MKKIIFTESQIKSVLDSVIKEQQELEATYGNPPLTQQMNNIKPDVGGKYCFTENKLKELNEDKTYKLYKVQKGDTIYAIVNKLGANSLYNILASNDLLGGKPENLRAGDVIAYSLAPTGN